MFTSRVINFTKAWPIFRMWILTKVQLPQSTLWLWLTELAMENGPFIFIDGLPIENGDFPVRKLLVITRE